MSAALTRIRSGVDPLGHRIRPTQPSNKQIWQTLFSSTQIAVIVTENIVLMADLQRPDQIQADTIFNQVINRGVAPPLPLSTLVNKGQR